MAGGDGIKPGLSHSLVLEGYRELTMDTISVRKVSSKCTKKPHGFLFLGLSEMETN